MYGASAFANRYHARCARDEFQKKMAARGNILQESFFQAFLYCI